MSQLEKIYLDLELTPQAAAEQLASALSLAIRAGDEGEQYVYLTAPGFGGVDAVAGGPLSYNGSWNQHRPDERTAFDACRLVWSLMSLPRDGLGEVQQRQAEALFVSIVDELAWPAVLLVGSDFVKATHHPTRGLRRFPPRTSPYVEDAAIWGVEPDGSASAKA